MTTLSSASGIYQIRNVINNKIYLGSTTNFTRRWQEHRRKLNSDKHHSNKLQRAWNKYGKTSFVFEILLLCATTELIVKEQEYLNNTKAYKLGYNCTPTAGNTFGLVKGPMSEEHKKKLSVAMTGKKINASKEGKDNQIAANKNRVWTEEAKYRAGSTNRGKTLSDDTKQKMSDSHKGKPTHPWSKESKQKLSDSAKKQHRTISPELQIKMKEARAKNKHPMPPGHQEKLIAARKAAKLKKIS